MSPERRRLDDIDRAKGLVIPLVVFTHIVLRGHPAGNAWYGALRTAIVAFDMPIFMYLSGLVMFYAGAADVVPARYPVYARKRAMRLMLPYAVMGLLILAGKSLASRFIFVDHAPDDFGQGVIDLFWRTADSPAQSMWYIFVIFIYCLITPPLLWLSRGKLWPLLVIGALIYPLPWPEYFFLNKIGHFFIFFVFGAVAARHLPAWQVTLDRWRWLFLALFAASFLLFLADMHWLARMAVIGTLSLPALHAMMRDVPTMPGRLLTILGVYCYAIYLFNTPFIGLAKGVLLHFTSWDGPHFLFFAPILFMTGIIGPMLFKRFVLRRWPAADALTN